MTITMHDTQNLKNMIISDIFVSPMRKSYD